MDENKGLGRDMDEIEGQGGHMHENKGMRYRRDMDKPGHGSDDNQNSDFQQPYYAQSDDDVAFEKNVDQTAKWNGLNSEELVI